MESRNIILTKDIIQKKLERIAYEIYELNSDGTEIILAGIWDRGVIIAHKIAAILAQISPLKTRIIELRLDKQHPKEVVVSENIDFNDKVIVVVDDVANSGRTMLYALKPFLDYLPKKIQTAVLVDRKHKSFPLSVDFVGYSLATTLQDMVLVEMNGEEIVSAYFD
ncbi:pyrimidine operon attenuation protein / uracil phosphoribosyltransferase [Chitinophaga terrae (ex Kim and Jung 2007)]|uniref:Pyrimidine operon attenuation protein / uracil phosphoribosyltransferase n=1 Tax=Chitinophaga terrae (ex Kim and Jung 2007) TaxID=408074 RepID=A0A1H3YQL9_9BACT|nr:phosphoribosyltransferase family protein [Chitinophaga terrae (ex Kim and Jung 2007)]MDQ0107128.1 pyrimidine operon attenuation protein/uracil phosphoribosyltransferase [Chitinophaga terrae (ex Kim and Jung 2007)]GEP88431.1 phosphoribosyltransferase [Chitinophaga terrae (ex Kim and Jung 2007)]SEA13378.1 pyrimidine operon attenuation protein / uracil phosphoribosyltransferase [Chitinophaga terrae (ex Kim and Jung 2007)]